MPPGLFVCVICDQTYTSDELADEDADGNKTCINCWLKDEWEHPDEDTEDNSDE